MKQIIAKQKRFGNKQKQNKATHIIYRENNK